MDTATLVEREIDGGQKVVGLLASHNLDVAAAFWVKPSEGDRWLFFVVSKVVDEQSLSAAYRAAHAALQGLPDRDFWLAELNLIGTKGPVAADVLEFQRRHPGRMPIRSRRARLGDLPTDEVYVYPPVWLPDAKWRGIAVGVFPELDSQDTYWVEFWPHEPQAVIPATGVPTRVPSPARVRVQGGRVVEYRPPEKPLPNLGQNDYEQKALEAVEQVGRGTP